MDKLVDHFIDQLNNTLALESPFVHYRVQNVLQAEFYLELCAAIPSPNDRLWLDHPNGGGYRKWIELDKPNNLSALTAVSPVWATLDAGLRSNVFIDKLASKFVLKNYRMNIQLVQDNPGYQISPHCDTYPNQAHKMLTMILYLSDDIKLKPYGTRLYNHKEKEGRHQLSYHSTVPFIKNTMLLFKPNYPTTWHGVDRYDLERPRISLQMFLKHL